MGFYATLKKNGSMTFAGNGMLSEIRQILKYTITCLLSHVNLDFKCMCLLVYILYISAFVNHETRTGITKGEEEILKKTGNRTKKAEGLIGQEREPLGGGGESQGKEGGEG